MRLLCALSVLCVPLLSTSEADSGDSACKDEIQVRCNTFYNVSLGQRLKIECPVKFCQNSTTISWYKLEGDKFTDASSSSHVNVEFNRSSPLEGTSFLVFENILRNDSGFYQCQSQNGDIVSYKIGVMVSESSEHATEVTSTQNMTAVTEPVQNWSPLIRGVGFILFAVTTVFLYKTFSAFTGSGRLKKTRDAAVSSPQPLSLELSSKHIYENDGLNKRLELSQH